MRVPRQPPAFDELAEQLLRDPELAGRVLGTTVGVLAQGKYRHWDVIRHLTPPAGLDPAGWWFVLKLARRQAGRALPLEDASGRAFTYHVHDGLQERLHAIDQRAGGEIVVTEQALNTDSRRRYLVSSLMEEAITSSQLEGAVTTRKVAKEMLRTGRQPRDHSEQMIVNNFRAMEHIVEVKDERLTPGLVHALHRLVTDGTLEDEPDAGRPQRPADPRVEVVDLDGSVLHRPPPAEQLPTRMTKMCDFANGSAGPDGWLHPVVRAVLLHFWLAYDHPYVDGNGRTARALFYWSMLHQGYWLAEYLSISRILRRAPAQYGRAFLYCETDDNDTTYFLDHHLAVICRAIDDLHDYLAIKMSELHDVELALRSDTDLNGRQMALLSHALRHPDGTYTYRSHARSHNVVLQSGRADLLGLEERGLLHRRKAGRQYVFRPVPDLAGRLQTS